MDITNLLQDILRLKDAYKEVLEEVITTNASYDGRAPEINRSIYDSAMAIIATNEGVIHRSKEGIVECIQKLKECEMLLTEISNMYTNSKNKLNRAKVGTLAGLVRQQIKENIDDYDVEGNEQVKFVMEQDYDEAAAIRRGGKYKMTRRSRKKRASKTSKRRR
jgi:hypothetical protein